MGRTAMTLVVASLPAALLAGCTARAGTVASSPRPTPPVSSPPRSQPGSQSPAATRPGTAGLTGLAGGIGRPVLAVKIDNTRPAHPQRGVDAADVVYVEQVEGGLTRLMAIFSSTVPAEIGPTRSARESDLELLREYGSVLLAFSGANRGVLAAVRASPVVDGSPALAPGSYRRDRSRAAPYNLFLQSAKLLAAKSTVPAHDIGLRFGAARPQGGFSISGFRVRFGPFASAAVRRSGSGSGWSVAMDGRAPEATPTNVLVQYVTVRGSRYHDTLGHPTPYTETVGSGTAALYRDGRRYPGRWSRPSADSGTRFTDASGRDLLLRPGRTWVLLVPVGIGLQPL